MRNSINNLSDNERDMLLSEMVFNNAIRESSMLTPNSKINEIVQEHIQNVILANIIPPHLEWNKVTKNKIHSRTAENYILLLRNHFLVHFSERTANSITTMELQHHFGNLAKKYSNSTIAKIHFLLHRMYRWGKSKWGIDNPLDSDDFTLPVSAKRDKKVEPYSDDEMEMLLSGVDDHPILKPIINLTTATGCRIQEILNLRWKHIDLNSGSIKIERALTLDTVFDENGEIVSRHTVDGRTKRQSSERILFVDEYTINLLLSWQKYAKKHTKTRYGVGDYIFGNTRGNHYTCSGFRSTLKRHLIGKYENGHELTALHRIRHTVATKAAEEGASTIELMQLLGDNQERSVLRYTGKSSLIAMKNRDRISKSMLIFRKKQG